MITLVLAAVEAQPLKPKRLAFFQVASFMDAKS